MLNLNIQLFGGRGSGGGKRSAGGGGSSASTSSQSASKPLAFERRQKLDGGSTLRLSNGDEIDISSSMSRDKVGTNTQQLKKTSDMEQHYTEDFILKGIGGAPYIFTREVIEYKRSAKVRGGRVQIKPAQVKQKR